MTNFITTFIAAFTLMILAVAGLGIGWILKKRPLKKGCGKAPGQGKCGKKKSCSICAPSHEDNPKS